MIVPDANLLLYAYCPPSPWHPAARAWLEDVLSGDEPVGFPLAVIQAFLRIGSSPRSFQVPFELAAGVAAVNQWLGQECARILNPSDGYWSLFSDLLIQCQCRGALVSDAHLAALAMENGALLCSADRGFSRFPGLRWRNPLAA